jgi:hypothetical protein
MPAVLSTRHAPIPHAKLHHRLRRQDTGNSSFSPCLGIDHTNIKEMAQGNEPWALIIGAIRPRDSRR